MIVNEIIAKPKRGKPPKRKSNNPTGRKGKTGAQQVVSTPHTSSQLSTETSQAIPCASGAHGSGVQSNKNKPLPTKPPPSARAIKVAFILKIRPVQNISFCFCKM